MCVCVCVFWYYDSLVGKHKIYFLLQEEKISLKTILQISKRLYKISSFKVLLVGGSIKKLLLRQYCGGWYTHGSELQIKIGIRYVSLHTGDVNKLIVHDYC